MKKIVLIFTLLISFMLTLTTACDKDKDKEPDGSIVGKWTCSNHYYGGSDTYTFNKNGKYTWTYSGIADWFDDQSGTYTFNGSLLTITNSRGTSFIYVVVGLSDTSMILIDEDGYKYTYFRQ